MTTAQRGGWDAAAIQKIQKIHDKINAGKKLTILEEVALEKYDNTHVDIEFNLIIGLNRDFTAIEKLKIANACEEAVRKLGYHEVQIDGGS